MAASLTAFYRLVVIDKSWIVLLGILAVTGFLSLYISQFELDASADSLTLENDQDLEYYRDTRKWFPSSNDFVVISFHPHEDLFSDASLNTIAAMKEEILKLKGVEKINSILDVPLLNDPEMNLTNITEHMRYLSDNNVDREAAKQELLTNPLYENMLVSKDGNTSAIQILLKGNPHREALLDQRQLLIDKKYKDGGLNHKEAKQLDQLNLQIKELNAQQLQDDREDIERIRAIMDKYRDKADMFLGGVPMIVVDMIRFVKNDLVVFGAGVVLFLLVTLALIFKAARWVVMPLLCCVLTCYLMVGIIGFNQWHVTVISSNFVSLLLIITMSVIIHLIVRYREFASEDGEASQKELVFRTVQAMVLPCLYTSVTTVVAFGSLLVSGIRPVIDFGFMMSIGISLAFVMAFLFFPAILAFLPRRSADRQQDNDEPFSVKLAHFTEHYGKALMFICVVLAVVCGYGISQLTVENRFIDYFKEDTEIYKGMLAIDQNLGGTTPLDVVIDMDLPEQNADAASDEDCFIDDECMEDVYGENTIFTPAKIKWFKEIHNHLESKPQIGKVLSIATTMEVAERIKGGPLDSLELAFMNSMFPKDLKSILMDPYVTEDMSKIRFNMRIIDSDDTLRRQVLLDDLNKDLTEKLDVEPDKLHFTSMAVLYNNMLQSLFNSQIKTIGVVFVGIMLMFLILFRSLLISVIAIIPNLFAAGVVLGGMGLAGIPLDMMTITIAGISVGIAVDDTIHYIYRFKAEFPKDRDYIATVYRSHSSIGKAMYYTSVTIILGFSILVLSNFYPTIYFGFFTALAMLIALLCALTLLPQLILLFKPFGPDEGGKD